MIDKRLLDELNDRIAHTLSDSPAADVSKNLRALLAGWLFYLALLPSEVAPGTYVWSPDGQTVAFVVHTASLAAVCTLLWPASSAIWATSATDGIAGPPVAPIAWGPDGRVLSGGGRGSRLRGCLDLRKLLQIRPGEEARGLGAADDEQMKTRCRCHALQGRVEVGKELARQNVDAASLHVD